jgi:hypothetical protein
LPKLCSIFNLFHFLGLKLNWLKDACLLLSILRWFDPNVCCIVKVSEVATLKPTLFITCGFFLSREITFLLEESHFLISHQY